MKKLFIYLSMAGVLIACGGGNKENSDKKNTGDKKEGSTDDLSKNPVYQEGLAIVSKPENLCLTCHKIDEKLTGPAYRDVANKYESTEENISMLGKKVKNGGSGVWGEIAMPPNPAISEEDAKKAVKYILLLKK